MDAPAHPMKWDNAGDTLPIAEGSSDFVHKVLSLWSGSEWCEPFNIREVERGSTMGWEKLGDNFCWQCKDNADLNNSETWYDVNNRDCR